MWRLYNLIIVDDDYQIRTGLSTFFPWNEVGFERVGSFENGRQALDFIKARRTIDVVLTDIRMPVMDGLELASRIRELFPQILVVLLSAHRNFEYAHAAINIGVQNYILKSTKYDELIAVFRQVRQKLNQQKAEQAPAPAPYIPEAMSGLSDRVVCRVLLHVQDNLATATLRSVSDAVGMSPIYLSRYFKDNAGMNFSAYMMDVRMHRAAEYLRDGRYRIAQISDYVGYSNEKNFSRAFKKYYGVSPIDYRRR